MTTNREFVLRTLQRIVVAEEQVILAELSTETSKFILAGQGTGSSRLTLARHRVTVAGVERAASKMMNEVRALAGHNAPSFAEDTGVSVGHLIHRLLDHYQQGVGETREHLIDELSKIREAVVDDLTNRPVSSPAKLGPLAGRDLNITATGPVAVAGRDAVQHIEGLDLAGLLAVLAEVRQEIEASQITTIEQDALTDQVVAMEAIAQQPKPDPGRLERLAKRLGDELLRNGFAAGAGLLEAYGKQRLGMS